MSEPNHHYPTNNTALATYLICSGYHLSSIDYSEPRYKFIFFSSPELNQSVTLFLTCKASVEPSAYQRINRKLIRLVKSKLQWEDEQ